MPKKLTVLTAMLAVVLVAAVPAFAQDEPVQESGPSPPPDAGLQPQPAIEELEPGEAGESGIVAPASGSYCAQEFPQYESPAPPPEVATDGSNYSACEPVSGVSSSGELQSAASFAQEEASTGALEKSAPACGLCGVQVAQAAKDVLTSGGSAGPSPKEAFGVALEAARDAGGTREALASEGTPEGGVEETAAYQAAFVAAKKAGADDETAREAALQALAELPRKGEDEDGFSGKASKAGASEKEARKGGSSQYDTGEDKDRKRNARKEGVNKRDVADEETMSNQEVVSSGGGTGTTPAPAKSSAPLIMGGGVLLVVGLFLALRARS